MAHRIAGGHDLTRTIIIIIIIIIVMSIGATHQRLYSLLWVDQPRGEEACRPNYIPVANYVVTHIRFSPIKSESWMFNIFNVRCKNCIYGLLFALLYSFRSLYFYEVLISCLNYVSYFLYCDAN